MRVLGIIPVRYNSSRLPGKPLALIGDRPMIQHVYENAKKSTSIEEVIIATDDRRIYDKAVGFGAQVMMTSQTHTNGTERCAEVVNKVKEFRDYDFVINIQGDEPFIQMEQLNALCEILNQDVELATMVKRINTQELLDSTSVMKVVINKNNEAMYFSRTAIPFVRDAEKNDWINKHAFYKHVCIYAYRTDILAEIASLPISQLEKAESLEQLRWLENGYKIKVGFTNLETMGVDTPQDLINANKLFE